MTSTLSRVAFVGMLGLPIAAEVAAQELTASAAARLGGKILFTRGTVELWDHRSARTLELQIRVDLAAIRGNLAPDAPPVLCASA